MTPGVAACIIHGDAHSTLHVTPSAFDPADAAERRHHLERRLAAAVLRLGDPGLVARVGTALTTGAAVAVFDLLLDDDERVTSAAHECAMLRFSWIVAIVAESFSLDGIERDDLVQRTFLDLPRVVRRAQADGLHVTHPEGWLRRRAYLVACQMLREERGSVVRDGDGRLVRTRGTRVALSLLDNGPSTHDDLLDTSDAEAVADALNVLAAERPVWAQVLRLHYFEGYRLDEVARRLKRTHGTVRNDAQRARARLLAILHERHPELPPRRAREGGSDA
jgi:RNA polymerase sigma factor (sigma-70 family)